MSARSASANLSKSPFAAALLGAKQEPPSPSAGSKDGWNKFIKGAIDETKDGEVLSAHARTCAGGTLHSTNRGHTNRT
jgi:hypothetical protein